jgi:AcrR family transcriptional regulator
MANQKESNPMESEQQTQPEKRVRMRGEERRALMLQHAKRVFARSTYAEAHTSNLAGGSEVTEPMLYKHFGSKKGLFLAVLKESSAQFLALLRERISRRAEEDILDALLHMASEYQALIETDPETERVHFQAMAAASDPDIARCVKKHNQAIYELIRQFIVLAQELGVLDATIDLEAATWGYMGIILTLQHNSMLDISAEVTRIQEEASRIWLCGLRAGHT